MKNILKNLIVFILCASVCCALFACNPVSGQTSGDGSESMTASEAPASATSEESGEEDDSASSGRTYNVILYEASNNEYDIQGSNLASVKKGGTAQFTVRMKNDYYVSQVVSNSATLEYEIISRADGYMTIFIKNVKFGMSINPVCQQAETYVAYHANGGDFILDDEAGKPIKVGYQLSHHLRPNTEIGTDRMKRDGYVLSGWNTKSDGTGEHIGLGSRATAIRGETLDLYAEWKKESPVTDITFRADETGLVVTGYNGEDEEVVIPSKFSDRTVYSIETGAFKNNDKIKSVVLPTTIKSVKEGAFKNCALEEIYFYDNLTEIADNCFENCDKLSTVHINAIEAPRYGKALYSEYNFADKYDILILHKDEDKVVVLGGSGAYFSVNAYQVEEGLQDAGIDKLCINMAVNGWFNGVMQIEAISKFLKDGDVFIHAPETSSRYNVCYSVTMTPENNKFTYNKYRLYYCLEANYDLITYFNVGHVTEFFDGFGMFNRLRLSRTPTSYTEYKTGFKWYGTTVTNDLTYIDERGSCALPRPRCSDDKGSGEADIVVEYISTGDGYKRLNAYYHEMEERGIKTFFMSAPINKDTLTKRLADPESFDRTNGADGTGGYLYYGRPSDIPAPDYTDLSAWVNAYAQAESEFIETDILVPLSKCLYSLAQYFEPDYHLADDTSRIYTADIVNALVAALAADAE